MKLPASLRDRLLPIALSQAVGLGCGIAGVKLASELISPADYGAYGLFLSFTPLGIWVVHAGLLKFVGRHWAASPNPRGLFREVLRAGVKKLPWLALLTLVAAVTLSRDAWPRIWPPLFASALLLSAGLLAQTALQAARAHWVDFFVSAAGSLTRTFIPPLLYAALGGSLFFLHAGFLLHACVFAGAGWLALRGRLGVASPSPVPQLTAVYDGSLFIALAVAAWTLTAVNRWIVAGFFGADAAGFFTLAGSLTVTVTSMLAVVFMQFFQPGLFAAPVEGAADRNALARRVDRLALAYTVLSLAGVGLLQLLAPWLIGVLIDERYRPALGFIAGAGCFGAAIMIAQFFHVMLLAGKRERACGPVDLSTATVLVLGGVTAAWLGGETWFLRWLCATPLVSWLLTRPLARGYLLRRSATSNTSAALG